MNLNSDWLSLHTRWCYDSIRYFCLLSLVGDCFSGVLSRSPFLSCLFCTSRGCIDMRVERKINRALNAHAFPFSFVCSSVNMILLFRQAASWCLYFVYMHVTNADFKSLNNFEGNELWMKHLTIWFFSAFSLQFKLLNICAPQFYLRMMRNGNVYSNTNLCIK